MESENSKLCYEVEIFIHSLFHFHPHLKFISFIFPLRTILDLNSNSVYFSFVNDFSIFQITFSYPLEFLTLCWRLCEHTKFHVETPTHTPDQNQVIILLSRDGWMMNRPEKLHNKLYFTLALLFLHKDRISVIFFRLSYTNRLARLGK